MLRLQENELKKKKGNKMRENRNRGRGIETKNADEKSCNARVYFNEHRLVGNNSERIFDRR